MSAHRRRRSPSTESSDSRSRSPHTRKGASPVRKSSRKSPEAASSKKDVGETFAVLAQNEIDRELAATLETENVQQNEKALEVSLGEPLALNPAKNLFVRCKNLL